MSQTIAACLEAKKNGATKRENYICLARVVSIMTTITDARLPEYVRRNLEYFLDHEAEDPERYSPLVDDLCRRWGI